MWVLPQTNADVACEGVNLSPKKWGFDQQQLNAANYTKKTAEFSQQHGRFDQRLGIGKPRDWSSR
jgi:hypothetical protein